MTCEAATELAGDPAPRVVDPRSGVLLCGEDNPYGSDQEFALYCAPRSCSGDRLRRDPRTVGGRLPRAQPYEPVRLGGVVDA